MTVYFERSGIIVDDTKVVIDGTTYPLANISSFKATKYYDHFPDNKKLWIIAAAGAFVGSVGFGILRGNGALSGADDENALFWIWALLSAMGAGIAWLWFRDIAWAQKTLYTHCSLELTTAGTTQHVLRTQPTSKLAFQVRDAMNQAIADKK